jgi:hypothetical protein
MYAAIDNSNNAVGTSSPSQDDPDTNDRYDANLVQLYYILVLVPLIVVDLNLARFSSTLLLLLLGMPVPVLLMNGMKSTISRTHT